jgi:hypothetical protein
VYQLPPQHFDLLSPRCVLREWLRPEVDRRPVTGPMASHVGAQHDLDTLARTIVLAMTDLFSMRAPDAVRLPTRRERAALSRVRSFDVPAVRASMLHAADEDSFPGELAAHLGTTLGGTSWLVPDDARWPLRKLLFFCARVPAPRDETTGAPMVLQLTGPIIALAGIVRHTAGWVDLVERQQRTLETGEPPPPLTSPFVVSIEAATYANCMSPAVGMPFYL